MTSTHSSLRALIVTALWLHGAAASAQPASAPPMRPAAPASAAQAAFKMCDARGFVAMNMARTYFAHDRNRHHVIDMVKRNDWALQQAEVLFKRVEEGKVRHPAEFAADVLAQCAAGQGMVIGASRNHVRLCFARVDVATQVHADRTRGLPREQAVSRAAEQFVPREVYPDYLLNSVADAVYARENLPDLRMLTSQMLWACIQTRPAGVASAASR